mmetsp:Transcript_3795/g.10758  ORF Transcript_3795/g.10758 Transcript_3795/m.10758 type:complete len:217 (+) Transcript_3795:2730-3380(+)
MSASPSADATASGVRPLSFLTSIRLPAVRSASTTKRWPQRTAANSGCESPSSISRPVPTLFCSSISTTRAWPAVAASASSWSPSELGLSSAMRLPGAAPFAASISTISGSPPKHAWWSAPRPVLSSCARSAPAGGCCCNRNSTARRLPVPAACMRALRPTASVLIPVSPRCNSQWAVLTRSCLHAIIRASTPPLPAHTHVTPVSAPASASTSSTST